MKTILRGLYDKLLDVILRTGKESGRNIIMRRQEHMEFVKACRSYRNRQTLASLFQDMGIKKIIILWNLSDNPFLWLRTLSLIRGGNIHIHLSWNIRRKHSQKKSFSFSTIYLYDKKGTPYDNATGEAFNRNDPYDLKSNGGYLCIQQLLFLMTIGENYKKERFIPVLGNLPDYFQSIAVLGNNRLARYAYNTLLKMNSNVYYIKISTAHSYKLTVTKKTDVILNMSFLPLEVTYDKKPVCTMCAYSILTQTPEPATDIDIANQIIPQLQKSGVKVVVAALSCWPDKRLAQSNAVKNAIAKRKFLISKGLLSRAELLPFNAQFCAERKNMHYLCDKGYVTLADQKGKLINVIHGMRYTCGNQDSASHRILMFGPCILYGRHVTDQNTIPSIMNRYIHKAFFIENHGNNFWNMNLQIRSESYRPGDIAIIFIRDIYAPFYKACHIPILDLAVAIDSVPRLESHFTDYLLHCDRVVNQKISETMIEYLNANHTLDEDICTNGDNVLSFGQGSKKVHLNKYPTNTDLKSWLNGLRQYCCHTERTGSIVMNCNPFTLGHRYLIEQACKQVDKLIIFVVEENKSFFPFQDRIEMVRIGTADLKNVIVIPSGKYIISAHTLPGYFEKDENPNVTFDATDDLDLFANVIAKELNISVRFVGEEPIDNYTRQYNQAMRKVLPSHGIEFVEIPRKEYGGSVISASRIRNLMKEKHYESIKSLVMPDIYIFLEEHYFGAKRD